MVIDAPRAVHVVVPHTLQIGGHVSGTRRSDEQVTAKLIVEGFQRAVGFSLAIVGQALVGGLVGRSSGQFKLHTAEKGHIVLEVCLEELVVTLPCGPGYPILRGFIGFYAHIGFRVGEIGVVVGGIIGVGGEQEYDLVGTVDAELAVFIGTGTSLGHDAEAHHVAQLVVVEPPVVGEQSLSVVNEFALAHGAGGISNLQLLLAGLRSGKTHRHHVGRIGHKGGALVGYAVGCLETDLGIGGVKRKCPAVVLYAGFFQARFHTQFAHGGE